jgi:hypothetical protein
VMGELTEAISEYFSIVSHNVWAVGFR